MCGKKPLTKDGATASLSVIKNHRKGRKADKKPCRKYYCNECEAWHLTSKSIQEFYQFIKNKKQ